MVAALFVETDGIYFGLPNVEPWDKTRDARTYPGARPVIAHPPCDRWCQMAPVNQARYGHRVGDDGGCFAAALEAVRRCQLPTADLGHHEVRFLRGVHEGGERIPRPERQPNPHGQVCGLQTGENINVDLFERLLFLYCEKGLR